MLVKQLKEALDKEIKDGKFDENEYYEALKSFVTSLPDWPQVTEQTTIDFDEEDVEMTSVDEALDIENFGIVSIKEKEVIFCSGGDWQTPQKLSLRFDSFNGWHLKFLDYKWECSITDDEFDLLLQKV